MALEGSKENAKLIHETFDADTDEKAHLRGLQKSFKLPLALFPKSCSARVACVVTHFRSTFSRIHPDFTLTFFADVHRQFSRAKNGELQEQELATFYASAYL